MRRGIIDLDSGEVVELEAGDRIKVIRESSINSHKKNIENISEQELINKVEINEKESFVKAYVRPMIDLGNSLTGAEMNLVYYMLPYLNYCNGMITANNGRPLAKEKIVRDLGVNKRQIEKLIKNLKDKQVIGIHKTGHEVQYFMNPWLFMKGQKINRTLHVMFKNTRWAKMFE